ncbi:MAG: 5'/3'-nucleotidase SurE, partial [Methanobrevibacter sp.]|nr:5'/3'-nucleotidase SurE [Methanobrevibacter sp.]
MKILLSNDDGVDASGILAAKQVADEFGETIVVAPSKQQSGIGHALTLVDPIRVNEVNLRDGDIGYGVTGTPTDAVTIAIYELMDEWPDLVISGINTGRNTGKGELSTSGTLGAASEAAS